jgi:Mrp family chromosome partitioning ATPase
MSTPRLPNDLVSIPATTDAGPGIVVRLLRRRRLFLMLFGLIMGAALGAILVAPTRYFAAGTVIIGDQEPTSGNASAWIQKLGDPADLESQLIIIRSSRLLRLALLRPGILNAVLRECNFRSSVLDRPQDCRKLTMDSLDLLDHVSTRYSAQAIGRSRVVSIGYTSPLPEVAAMMANALLIAYLEDQRAENARSRGAASIWLLDESKRLDAAGERSQKPVIDGAESANEDTFRQARSKFYRDLYSKASDLEAERRTLVSSGRLVSLAEAPRLPSFPKRVPMLAAGLTAATLLAAFAALHRDATNLTVHGTREVRNLARAPVLAVVPHVKLGRVIFAGRQLNRDPRDASGEVRKSVSVARQRPEIARVFRELCVRLFADHESGKRLDLLVSSATHGDGKTFTAALLAEAAADLGHKVLLVDLDTRSPGIAACFSLDEQLGLADCLVGNVATEAAIVRDVLPGLDILPAGSPRGATCLSAAALSEIVTLADGYQLLLFDGPSIGDFPEAGLLAQVTRKVLLCARWDFSKRADVEWAVRRLRKSRFEVVGVAFGHVDLREQRYFERDEREVVSS